MNNPENPPFEPQLDVEQAPNNQLNPIASSLN